MAIDTNTEGCSSTLYDTHEHDDSQELTVNRPSSRNLVISPNLVAALEFDERVRRSSSPSPTPPTSAGLPPPPRAKNGGSKSRKAHSVTIPGFQPLQHIPPNLPSDSSAWNPYINPKPLIPYLMFDEPTARPHAASAPTSPVVSSTHKFVPQRAPSLGVAADSPATHRAHRRYLSALPKVEWLFGRGAGGIGKKLDVTHVNESEGHGSGGEMPSRLKPYMQEKQPKRLTGKSGMAESMMATTSTSIPLPADDESEGLTRPTSSPSWTTTQGRPPTPVTAMAAASPGLAAVATTTSRGMTETGAGPAAATRAWPGSRVSIAASETRQQSSHDQYAVDSRVRSRKDDKSFSVSDIQAQAQVVPQPASDSRLRLLPLSTFSKTTTTTTTASSSLTATIPDMPRTKSSNSARSTDTASSVSHDPLSPETERRISISSTAYPASSINHSYDSHFSYHRQYSQSRPSMSPEHDSSFIELASPITTPRSPDFPREDGSMQERVTSIYSTTSFNVNPNLYKQKSKELPVIRVPSPGSKPPLPTTPKPAFSRRSESVQPSGHRSSSADTLRGSSPVHPKVSQTLPPTTTFLNPRERAERVRQNRKLTQMFGQTPGNVEAVAFSTTAYEPVPSIHLPNSGDHASSFGAKRKHLRGAASMSVTEEPPVSAKRQSRAVWPPPEGTMYLSLGGARRHSSPLTTQEFTLPDIETVSSTPWSETSRSSSPVRDLSDLIEVGSEEGVPHSDWSSHAGHAFARKAGVVGPGSPTSFMDLSDEEGPGDIHSIISVETPKASTRRGRLALFSPSTPSLQEKLSPEEQAEEDRRRKRDKLARLHRFLGSRIPVDLVLAQVGPRIPTPPPAFTVESMSRDTEVRFKARIRRRRSSSAAELGGTWSDDIDRLKEDLNEREKAINVRRAVKMEKMFGVAPPQTLYHTRRNGSPSNGGQADANLTASPRNRTPPQSPITTALRNHNQSAYTRGRGKKSQRPGTADSSEPLIKSSDFEDVVLGHALSDIYMHYRHSLNSLNDIIDRADKESLVDLHDYLHGSASDAPLQQFTLQNTHNMIPSTSRVERRRSLPARASLTSLSSEFSINSVSTNISSQGQDSTNFQNRRRRAAKLTQFFGVDYRDLMSEILDSIEKGVEEEGGRGALKPDEVQDLLQKLRKLKVKRNNLS